MSDTDRAATPAGQLVLDFGPPPPPTLANFVAGANAECLAALAGLLAACGRGERPANRFIYVWGAEGSGKSHLARALASAADAGGCDGLVVVDDCDRLAADAQTALFHRFNELSARVEGALVAFGRVPPARLALIPELASRLAWGLVFALAPLSEAERITALERAAQARGLVLGPEVSGYLLRHAPRDLGSLTAILDRLDRLALERQRPVTVALARELLAARPGAAATGPIE